MSSTLIMRASDTAPRVPRVSLRPTSESYGFNSFCMRDGIGAEFEANRSVTIGKRDDELIKMAISHNDELCATAIDITSLPYEGQQRRIYQKLLISIGLGCRCIEHAFSLPREKYAAAVQGHVADRWRQGEDARDQIQKLHQALERRREL